MQIEHARAHNDNRKITDTIADSCDIFFLKSTKRIELSVNPQTYKYDETAARKIAYKTFKGAKRERFQGKKKKKKKEEEKRQ